MTGSCASDDKNDRVLNGYYQSSDEMTIQLCLTICRDKGFAFAGLEYVDECYCGDKPEHGFEWLWQTKCNLRCSGDGNQVCGGSSAMSVWSVPSKNLNGLCVYDFPRRILNGESRSGSDAITKKWCQTFCSGKSSI